MGQKKYGNFSELQNLLENSDKRKYILQTLDLILTNGYPTVQNFMRRIIWSSGCKDTLINIVVENAPENSSVKRNFSRKLFTIKLCANDHT